MVDPIHCEVRITLESSLHLGTGLGLGQLIDDRSVQGPHPDLPTGELPYIPGSSLKGRLRHHVRQLGPTLLPQTWAQAEALLFGFPGQAGRLVFPDVHLEQLPSLQPTPPARDVEPDATAVHDWETQVRTYRTYVVQHTRPFVSLSRQRRVALPQRLFRIDMTNAGLAFTAVVRGSLPHESVRRDLALLVAAMRDLTHLGGHKARGLGACQCLPGLITIAGQPIAWQALLMEGLE